MGGRPEGQGGPFAWSILLQQAFADGSVRVYRSRARAWRMYLADAGPERMAESIVGDPVGHLSGSNVHNV